ncbi:glutathione peroxidase [Psychromicrobium xiongbiense]|uniref:glutathione peroxidase n=1 Tax=Psychromicrobium xiongbiense TaxID=3051184 RepID=UPI0025534F5D|nr:glutathione peroxidase [Psychromicrobium sp. YIM S02556]
MTDQAPTINENLVLTLSNGQMTTFGTFRGKAVLVVNVASQCGFTPQYAGLEQLYTEYRDRGLEVLGVPSNQFGGQEPGTNEEIVEFCTRNFGVTFPLTAKTDVKGAEQAPLYAGLTQLAAEDGSTEVKWNFEKFLISPSGEVVRRFGSQVTPDDDALRAAVESVLPGSAA